MRHLLLLIIITISSYKIQAQYAVNGSAIRQSCNCYTITRDTPSQFGAVWNINKINLKQSFDFSFNINLGCVDGNGADGMAFVLQKTSTTIGTTGTGGGSMGYLGISPAVGVTLDTYQNTSPDNDPSYDHLAIQLNGVTNHSSASSITSPTPISATNNNVEDCLDHLLRIVWNADSTKMEVYFDSSRRISTVYNFVTNVFSGDSMVYWGFTGATGQLSNLQKFCRAIPAATLDAYVSNVCIDAPSIPLTGGLPPTLPGMGVGVYIIDTVVNTNGNFNPVTAGVGPHSISYIYSDAGGCIDTATQNINVRPLPTNVNAGNDASIQFGTNILLSGTAFADTILWSPILGLDNPSILTPLASPEQTTVYTLTATTQYGCKLKDSMRLVVNITCFDPPNIFTPNNDGFYDKWVVYNLTCLKNLTVDIYNRWGGLVYHSSEYKNNWDGNYKGKPLPDATYYYVCNVTNNDGSKFVKKGSVTIMR
jgi:gliding motility-associated-like protein